MRNVLKVLTFFVVLLLTSATIVVAVKLRSVLIAAQKSEPPPGDQSALLKGFAAIQQIDVHTHIYDVHTHIYKDDPELNSLVEHLNLRSINICVIDDRDPDYKALEPQRSEVLRIRRSTAGRLAFCTTFSPYAFEEPSFSARTIRQLDGDFDQGAVATTRCIGFLVSM